MRAAAPHFCSQFASEVGEDLSRVLDAGSEEMGWLAQTGEVPLGYLGDPAKTAKTFPVIDGLRYSVPGDRARQDEVIQRLRELHDTADDETRPRAALYLGLAIKDRVMAMIDDGRIQDSKSISSLLKVLTRK